MSGSEKLIESQRDNVAFRESEEHYRAVAEAATYAIITIDSDSTILIGNPAAEKIFGYYNAEMIGQPLTENGNEKDQAEAAEAGAIAFLRKPFAEKVLLAAIDSALKQVFINQALSRSENETRS